MATIFGVKHVIILILSIALITLLTVFLKNKKLSTWVSILFVVGILSESTKLLGYILMNESVYGGYLPKTDLPFQLCSIQLIFIAILYFSKNDGFKRLIMAFMLPTCLIGGFLAIVLPTSSALNSWAITFQYFGYHSFIVAFAIYLLINKEMNWTVKDYFTALKFLAFMALIAVYVNSMFYEVSNVTVIDGVKTVEYASRVNFMYIIDPPVNNLPILNKEHGWLVYVCHYAIIAVTAITLCYIKPIINAIKDKKQRSKEN